MHLPIQFDVDCHANDDANALHVNLYWDFADVVALFVQLYYEEHDLLKTPKKKQKLG